MQDMATMQQHSITSPAPATTVSNTQDSSSVARCGSETHQEASRTAPEDPGRPDAVPRPADKTTAAAADVEGDQQQEEEEVAEGEVSRSGDGDADAPPPSAEEAEEEEEEVACETCGATLPSRRLLALHAREHESSPKGYACTVCGKALSSPSSLERHSATHSPDRPFKCRACGAAFATSPAMHRHARTHAGAEDSEGGLPKKRRVGEGETVGDGAASPGSGKRKAADAPEEEGRRRRGSPPGLVELSVGQRLQCPRCEKGHFVSLQELDAHLEEAHAADCGGGGGGGGGGGVVRCQLCEAAFKNPRALNIHRFTAHRDPAPAATPAAAPAPSPPSRAVVGFKDLTFVDFSSEKFPHIARLVCERSLHRPTSAFHRFQCEACGRAFPCGTALDIHRAACAGRPAPPPGCPPPAAPADAAAAPADAPTDLSTPRADPESEEELEERKRDDFFAGLDLRNKTSASPSPDPAAAAGLSRRDEPFDSGLYFNAVPPPSRDLADIQSIISVTNSSGGMLHDLSTSGGGSAALAASAGEEEQQDDFAAEFRRMKLKGEFPCRLCPSVFPNLRALKGHNRVHLTASSGPFRCNMCPFVHSDKTVLVRHLRTHNGDRPYECALCNYAFTTKANCERHLRNRHAKLSREEVKKSIIYHPSEDPTNDPAFVAAGGDAPASTGPPAKRALVFDEGSQSRPSPPPPPPARPWEDSSGAPSDAGDERPPSTPGTPADEDTLQRAGVEALVSFSQAKQPFGPLALVPQPPHPPHATLPPHPPLPTLPPHIPHPPHQPIQDQRIPNDVAPVDYERTTDSPLDLSMDALDLSKKKETKGTASGDREEDEIEPQDLSRKRGGSEGSPISTSTPPPLFPAGPPKLEVTAAVAAATNLYASHRLGSLLSLNSNGFIGRGAGQPPVGTFQPLPFFLPTVHPQPLYPPMPANAQEIADMKERLQKELIRGLQLTSGGTLLDPHGAAGQLRAFHNQVIADASRAKDTTKMEIKEISADMKPLPKPVPPSPVHNHINNKNINNNNNNNNNNIKAVRDREAPGAVKMVIKNGVLMPKQKQRRYRTERPFACEHCSARFTLRSNMERHIKQQHPQFWSQRQRGATAVPNGPVRRLPVNIPMPPPQHSPLPGLQLKAEPMDELSVPLSSPILMTQTPVLPQPPALSPTSLQIPMVLKQEARSEEDSKSSISDEVRLLIAQQLKSKRGPASPEPIDDEDGDGELVIDEEKAVEEDLGAPPVSSAPSVSSDTSPPVSTASLVSLTTDSTTSTAADATPSNKTVSQTPAPCIQNVCKPPAAIPAPPPPPKADPTPLSPTNTTSPSVVPTPDAAPTAKSASSTASPELQPERKDVLEGGGVDLASVSRLLDNASTQTQAFQQYFRSTQDGEEFCREEGSEEDEEGLVAGSNSEENNSGSDENKSESETAPNPVKKKSAYSLAPNRVSCPFCYRKFPWSSSLRRHVLTHTGQKPFKCPHCPLLFTTKSNCDRHLLRKHSNNNNSNNNNNNNNSSNSNSSNNNSSNVSSSGCSSGNISSSGAESSAHNSSSSGSETSPTSNSSANSSNYTMRNVPERPYKCNYCPSSTFSTLSNLRKHVASKHSNSSSNSSPPMSPTSHNLVLPGPGSDASGLSRANSHYEESHCGSGSEDGDRERRPSDPGEPINDPPALQTPIPAVATPVREAPVLHPVVTASNSSTPPSSSDLPFKCHLCDGGFAERQDALDHIRDVHPAEFELLMSKGALDMAAEDSVLAQQMHAANHSTEDGSPTTEDNMEQLRGRFPDYANRKVMCAFCMRRFWSAEDLRRHMRTHTGERPFSCDICRRRFTLKHSMLRHRKKHAAGGSLAIPAIGTANTQTEDGTSAVSGDEEAVNDPPPSGSPASSISGSFSVNHNNNNIIPGSAISKAAQHRLLVDGVGAGDEETDLIGNLLGIQDRSIIDKVLQSKSADDAAKLLGVKNGSQE